MKPNLSSKATLWRSGVLFTIILIIVTVSCRKSQQSPSSKSLTDNSIDIESLKANYSRDTTPSVGRNLSAFHFNNLNSAVSKMIDNRNVLWQNMYVIKRDSSTVIEFELESSNKKWTLDAAPANTANKNLLVFIQYASGDQLSFYMKVIESIPSSSSQSVIKNFHYQNAPQNFSGTVMYYDLQQHFLNGWAYQNGNINAAIAIELPGSNTIALSVSLPTFRKIALEETSITQVCNEAYNYNYVAADGPSSGVWVDSGYQECYFLVYDDDSGSGSGSGSGGVSGGGGSGGSSSSSPAPPVPCNPPATEDAVLKDGRKITLVAQPPPGGGGGTNTGTGTTTSTNPCPTNAPLINLDSLLKKNPCAAKLIVDKLLGLSGYQSLVAPFTTTSKPNLTWDTSNLPWDVTNANGSITYQLGNTSVIGNSYNADITLNTSMLQNSSQLLIAAASIHETLHAVINYNMQMAGYDVADGNVSNGSWMYGIDSWYYLKGLPSNFSNHYVMMSYYFNQAVYTLAAWDNNAHTTQQYVMAMLYGMDQAGTGASQSQIDELHQEYLNLMSQYGINETDMETYWKSQLNASSTNKLPGSC